MKRFFLGSMILIVFLVGCSSESLDLGNKYTLGQDDQFYFSGSSGQSLAQSMTETEDGYYFLSGPCKSYIYYIDKKTMKPVILCNKPDCLHAEEPDIFKVSNCNAFFGDYNLHLVAYNSYLYAGGVDEYNAYSIYQISLDGTQKKKFYTFKDYHPEAWIMHRGYIYFVVNDDGTVQGQEATTQNNCMLYRIGLNNLGGEPTLLYKIGMVNGSTWDLFGYGNNIYWNVVGMDAALTKDLWQALRFDISDGKAHPLEDDMIRIVGVCDGNLIFKCVDGITYKSGLDGSDKKEIGKISDMYDMVYSDGVKYLYCVRDPLPAAYNPNGETTRSMRVYDLEGNLVNTMDIDSLGKDSFYGGNGDYIFVPDSISNSNEYGGINMLWAIDENTLGSANPEIEKVFEFVPRAQFPGWVTPSR
jgi:hypothetical protein